ncbi:MAG: DUF3035 domain-containing protein [Pseudorhodobacter sp.]|nr:DUF3035 domain-containing protein [Pseudorhodobacter sp.]
MRKQGWGLAVAGIMLVLLTACGTAHEAPRLMNLRAGADGPDEFAILPPKALANPTDMSALPEPTPGGSNRTDQNPEADAIAALGGKVPAPAGGIAVADAALTQYAARQGVTPDIRATLAAEDLRYRQTHRGRLLERLFSVTTYYEVYSSFALNAYTELARWQAAGVATPSAPPRNP